MTAVGDLLAEIERAPTGPEVGAFFDFDGTLIAGYSAQVFYEDRIRRFEMSPGEIARSLIAGLGMAVNGADVSKLMEVAVANWAGHPEDEVRELWERLFYKRISGMVYPEARELVRAHQRAGHTVAVASSATRYQLAPLAEDLGVTNVLASEVELVKGYFSGYVRGPVLWGPAKAHAVTEFAAERDVDLRRSFAYADGDEDVPLLETVGNPRALNPGAGMLKAAREHGWPAVELGGRGRPGIADVLRTGAALTGLGAAGGLGIAVGLLMGDRRTGANLAAAMGPDLALALAGVKLNVSGEEHLWSHRPAVFIFNHQSSIDVAVIGSLVRRDLTGVAKIEAKRDPRFAPIGYVTDIVYVDRSNSTQARAALKPAVDRSNKEPRSPSRPREPEAATPTLGRFKKGAFHLAMQAGVPLSRS